MRSLCRLGASLLLAVPAMVSAAEMPRTMALVDFSVRAPEAAAGESAWLGPAIAELLQAKMQRFQGAQVLERARLLSLLPGSKQQQSYPEEDLAVLSAIIPAELLIAGSVQVVLSTQAASAGGGEARRSRIKVQARAFETATAKVIADAAFSNTADLQGLLSLAEELAGSLAAGLGLAYTPEQLAYAEPARLEALMFLVEGNACLAAGRHREAVNAYQKALMENGGRFFPAAHRSQGEAYQALAQATPGPAAGNVREEYLKKFREDALIASGALFDLGLALETNGLWEEAIATYSDYLAAVGQEGTMVKWTVKTGLAGDPTNYKYFLEGQERIHYIRAGRQWAAFNNVDGKVLRVTNLRSLSDTIDPEGPCEINFLGAVGERVYLNWRRIFTTKMADGGRSYSYGAYWIGGFTPSLELLWKKEFGGDNPFTEVLGDKLIVCAGGRLSMLNADTGVLFSSLAGLEYNRSNRPVLTGLDRADLRWSSPDGAVLDLTTGKTIARQDRDKIRWPTDRRGIAWSEAPDGVRLFRDGTEFLFLPGCQPYSGHRPAISGGHFLFRRKQGYLLVNLEKGTTAELFKEIPSDALPDLVGLNETLAVFFDEAPAKEIGTRHVWGLPFEKKNILLKVFDPDSGRFLATVSLDLPDLNNWHSKIFLLGGDLIYGDADRLCRVKAVLRKEINLIPAGVAHLRRGVCELASGEAEKARAEVDLFETEFPRDYRAALMRLRLAASKGEDKEAALFAVRALGSGRLDDAEAELCLQTIRKTHPEVRRLIRTAVKRHLRFESLSETGSLVCTIAGSQAPAVQLLVDTRTGRSRRVEYPELSSPKHIRYRGEYAYYTIPAKAGLHRINLLTGERLSGQAGILSQGDWSVPGMILAGRSGNNSDTMAVFDPESLAPISSVPLGRTQGRVGYIGNGLAAFVGPLVFDPRLMMQEPEVLVVDRPSGKELGRFIVHLGKGVLWGVAADREAVYLTIAGADWDALCTGGKGSWFRVIAHPLSGGAEIWAYESEGWLAGNPVIEAERIAFPAFEGHLGIEGRSERFGKKGVLIQGELPLRRIFLDRRTGRRLADELLSPREWEPPRKSQQKFLFDTQSIFSAGDLFFPKSPLRLFPGEKATVRDNSHPHAEYWVPAPGARPVTIHEAGLDMPYRVDVTPGFEHLQLFFEDTVFESVGGGVILVKDLSGGLGRENIAPSERY